MGKKTHTYQRNILLLKPHVKMSSKTNPVSVAQAREVLQGLSRRNTGAKQSNVKTTTTKQQLHLHPHLPENNKGVG